MRTFTVCEFNAHDTATTSGHTFMHLTERPQRDDLLLSTRWGVFWPERGADAFVWDTLRLEAHGRRIMQAWKSGREHGRPGTTPRGYVLSWWGLLDDEHLVAFVGSHLVNNAFGPPVRGERVLRLALWWQGWTAMRTEAKRLRQLGYDVFKLGDLNRRPAYWPGILQRSIGAGYDRIVWPKAVELLESWRENDHGSDHRPLVGRFRFAR